MDYTYEERLADFKKHTGEWYQGGYRNDADSGVIYPITMEYLQDQQSQDANEWKPLKALYNGFVVQAGRGLVGSLQALRDQNIKQHQEQDPNYKVNEEAVNILDSALKSSMLTPYEVRKDTTASQLIYGLVEGAGQLAAQAIVSGATGGIGGGLFMGTQIAGNQYTELREQGIDADRAFKAAVINAVVQAPLEQMSFAKIFKKLPAGSAASKKARQIIESFVTEGVTESIQELPEQLTDIWAKNEGLDARGIAREWDKNYEQNIKDMVFSGVIGGLLGGGASGLNIGIRTAIVKQANKAMTKSLEKNAEIVKKSGVNPKYAATAIDARGAEGVSIDAAAVQQYAAEHDSLKQVAESLGVTPEQINDAAANGQDIGVTRGNLTAAIASREGFIDSIRDKISFDDGTGSVNYLELKKDLLTANEASEQASRELDAELDKIIGNARTAGISSAQADNLRVLLESRAMIFNPTNPAEWFKKHPLTIRNGGIKDVIDYAQSAWHGSPYKFDKFDIGKIGAGEGNQIYGWGLYFAQNRKISEKYYRDRLAAQKKPEDIEEASALKITYKDGKTETVTRKDQFDFLADWTKADGTKSPITGNFVFLADYNMNIQDSLDYFNRQLRDCMRERADMISDGKTSSTAGFKKLEATIKEYQKMVTFLKSVNSITAAEDNITPSLYEVEIPDNDVLLDREKALKDQPSKVREAIRKLGLTGEEEELTGKRLYELATQKYGSAKAASQALNSAGIKGITYYGRRDGRCYVVFDDKAVEIIEAYNQKANSTTKGAFSPGGEEGSVITLFEHSDASTVIHEVGHYFLEAFMADSALPDADENMKRDRQKLLDYMKMTEEEWTNADLEGRRAGHEKVAEAFETYFIEGKAPSLALRSVFDRFSKWLKAVYTKYVRNNNAVELTDEVRDVFDHWLAADMDIEQAARTEGIFAALPGEITSQLSDKNRRWLEDKIAAAKEKAVNKLTREYMRNFSQERRKAIAEYKAQITPDIEEQVANELVNQARDAVAEMFGKTNIAIPNTIARKYKNYNAPEYKSTQEYLDALNQEINDRLKPILARLEEGYGNGVADHWIDTETGEEADVGGLTGEKKSGWQYKRERYSLNAPWYQEWFRVHGRRPTKKDLWQLAYDIYTGNDEYGVYSDITISYSQKDYEESAAIDKANKEEIDQLIADRDAVMNDADFKAAKARARLTDEQAIAFETLAEDLGYNSGDAMADAILTEPSARKMVRDRVEQAVNAKFPDIAKERALAEAAQMEALYNDESGEVIALEQQLIEEAAQTALNRELTQKERKALAAVRKAEAEREATAALQKMSMGDAIKTARFAVAERRAAANAKRAIKNGDLEAAAEFKRQQAVSHAMVRKSIQLKNKVEDNRKFIRKLRTIKKEHFGTDQHLSQVGAFLARMGIVRRDYNPEYKTQTLQQYLIEMQGKLGDMVVENAGENTEWPNFILDESNDLRDSLSMSIEDYNSVIRMLKQLDCIAVADRKATIEGKKKAFEKEKANILAALDNVATVYKPEAGKRDGETSGIKEWGKAKWRKFIWSMLNADNLFERMDGWKQGYFSKVWYGMLKHCADHEATLTLDYQERTRAMEQEWKSNYTKEELNDAAKRREYEELKASADKFMLIQMLCNLGNEGNSRRICRTPPLGFEQSTLWVRPDAQVNAEEAERLTRQNLLEFLGRNLTEADIRYAQAKIDLCDSYWNDLAGVNRRTKGFAPERVEAMPAVLTLADGQMVEFRGGYFPLVRDSRNGSRPQSVNALAATDEVPGGNITTMTTNQGSSQSRTNAAYPVALYNNAELVTMRNTIHDICYREAMIYMRKNFNDPEIFAKLKSKMGAEGVRVLREILEKCASPYANTYMDYAESTLAATADWLRRKTVNTTIACNLKVILQNYGNVFLYGNSVEGFTHADVLTAIPDMLNPNPAHYRQMRDKVYAKSVFMRERAKIPEIAMRDTIMGRKAKDVEKLGLEWGTRLLELTDNITALPVWNKAYDMKIQAGESEQAAIDFADTVIRRTLGSSRVQDVASIQRGSPLMRLFTSFQSFFNTQFNQWYREANIDIGLTQKREWKEAFMRVSQFVIAKVLLACLANVFFGGENPFEKDKKGWRGITKELVNYPISLAGPYGQAANVLVQQALGMENYGYRLSVVETTINRGIRYFYTAGRVAGGEKEASALIEPTLELASIGFGVPLQFIRTGGNIVDIMFNDMTFELRDIMSRRPQAER